MGHVSNALPSSLGRLAHLDWLGGVQGLDGRLELAYIRGRKGVGPLLGLLPEVRRGPRGWAWHRLERQGPPGNGRQGLESVSGWGWNAARVAGAMPNFRAPRHTPLARRRRRLHLEWRVGRKEIDLRPNQVGRDSITMEVCVPRSVDR